MLKTIFFDLDGTLCPMDQEQFIKAYMKRICRKAAEYGYDPQVFSEALWKGTGAMMKNNGTVTNREVFWAVAEKMLGEGVREKLEAPFNTFYENEFDAVKEVLGEPIDSPSLIASLRKKGYRLVLATSPLFPLVAVKTRLSWVGLTPDDFDYVTTYENCTYCKPSLDYYREILERIGECPEHCMMVGNNVAEDMVAEKLQFSVYLITDYLENPSQSCYNTISHGSFRAFCEVAAALPNVDACGE